MAKERATEKRTVSRRTFMQSTASTLTAATTMVGGPAILSQPSPNETVGLGHIGVGVRGYELMAEAIRFPAFQYRTVCDLYDGFLKRGVARAAGGPNLKATKRYEEVIADKDIDAVIIAVPDHWHAQIALEAAEAGKHVYLEKPFTNTLAQARILVETVRQSGISFQLGHNLRSTPAVWKARDLVDDGKLGELVHIRAQHYRNSLEPYLRWYGFYNNYEMPADADPEHIDWNRFQQTVRKHSFHPYRFFHWRCYWDYTNGVAGDLQSHALDAINAIVGMGIPDTCVATGGLYFWRDGRETPDTWNAVFDYPERGLSINYAHVAMSDHYGTGIQIMGNDAALDLSGNDVKLFAERSSTKYRDKVAEMRKESGSFNPNSDPVESYRPEASFEQASHVGDWLRGILEGKLTRSNIDTAWEEIVTVMMAYESFRRGCKVRWDRERQEII
jgi:predicted dehydrogenase